MADQQTDNSEPGAADSASANRQPKQPKPPGGGPIRDMIDGVAFAIMLAVLMKWFAVEAYQIPTSSMQPTMMGCKEAGVFDRILVDKTAYLLRDPQRWDIAVFRYPIRKIQNYVKRIAGVPGDKLTIAAGNIYRVTGTDPRKAADVEPIPRPESVQEGHWREIFPARAVTHRMKKSPWRTSAGWEVSGEAYESYSATLKKGRVATLSYLDDGYGGLVNQVSDGYEPEVARDIHAEWYRGRNTSDLRTVVDARLEFTLEGNLDEWMAELSVQETGGQSTRFAAEIKGSEGKLVAVRGSERVESEAFSAPALPARLQFVHLDDRLLLTADDEIVAELETGAFKFFGDMRAYSGSGTDSSRQSSANLRLVLRGTGPANVTDVRVDRDQHYVQDKADDIIEVPEGHYWMLGDNTLQSVDSRGWTAFRLAVDDDDNIVDPATHPDARQIIGNMRPWPLTELPDADENPVPIVDEGRIAVTDEIGEVYSLKGQPGEEWVIQGGFQMQGADGETPWSPTSEPYPFVPREHILGRPLINFLRSVPYRWHRFQVGGAIR